MERWVGYWGSWVIRCPLLVLHMGQCSAESVVSPLAWGRWLLGGKERERAGGVETGTVGHSFLGTSLCSDIWLEQGLERGVMIGLRGEGVLAKLDLA